MNEVYNGAPCCHGELLPLTKVQGASFLSVGFILGVALHVPCLLVQTDSAGSLCLCELVDVVLVCPNP